MLLTGAGEVPVPFFGHHNLLNLSAARRVCRELGIGDQQFYSSITSFSGASFRLERLCESQRFVFFRDFAHAPSKVRATTAAVRGQFPSHYLVACVELHTFSSLNAAFLPQYAGALDAADEPIVYYNPKVVEHKKLPPLAPDYVAQCFKNSKLRVFDDRARLVEFISSLSSPSAPVAMLMMSSGTFDGLSFAEFAAEQGERFGARVAPLPPT